MSQLGYRLAIRSCAEEALALIQQRSIRIEASGLFRPFIWVSILPLPSFIFWAVMNRMYFIGPLAYSSMSDDLKGNVETEVMMMNGEVVRQSKRLNGSQGLHLKHSSCEKVVELIQAAEKAKKGWPCISSLSIYQQVTSSSSSSSPSTSSRQQTQYYFSYSKEDVALIESVFDFLSNRCNNKNRNIVTIDCCLDYVVTEFRDDEKTTAAMVESVFEYFAANPASAFITKQQFLGMITNIPCFAPLSLASITHKL